LEIQSDLGIPPSHEGCLSSWARQGVLMLNAHSPSELASRVPIMEKVERFTRCSGAGTTQREDPVLFLCGQVSTRKMCAYFREQKKITTLF